MIDFVTLIFNNEKEINLLKIQAFSFHLIDINLINNIVVIFNDDENSYEKFKNEFKEIIIEFYPKEIQNKVRLISILDLNIQYKETTRFTQQAIKLYISKYISTDYYIILDGKNHFIKNINKDTFFKDNKPIFYYYYHNEDMLKFYFNCFNYFNIDCPRKNLKPFNLKIQTNTPFIFKKQFSIELIEYIENKEKITFFDFLIERKTLTEFFLYYAFMNYKKYSNEYFFMNNDFAHTVTIGAFNQGNEECMKWGVILNQINTQNIKIMALHRNSLSFLNKFYKEALISFYKNIYNDKKINEVINKLLEIKN
jgi:hypothetical protein